MKLLCQHDVNLFNTQVENYFQTGWIPKGKVQIMPVGGNLFYIQKFVKYAPELPKPKNHRSIRIGDEKDERQEEDKQDTETDSGVLGSVS